MKPLLDRVQYALAVQRMTAPWPKPTPPYILALVDEAFDHDEAVYLAASKLRGQMIMNGHDDGRPHLASKETRHG